MVLCHFTYYNIIFLLALSDLFKLFLKLGDSVLKLAELLRNGVGNVYLVEILDSLSADTYHSCRYTDSSTVVRNIGKNDGTCGDSCVVADVYGTEHLRACTYHDAVSERGVTLALVFSRTAERNALIDRAVISDDGSFTDNNAGTVVNKQSASYLCGGVDLNICLFHTAL